MSENRDIICIVCPNGCNIHIEYTDGNIQNAGISGNKCKRGAEFARAELTKPVRTLCSTVRTAFPETPVLPVRVSAEIPRERVFDVMAALREVRLERPAARGDVIIPDVLGLGVDVIATADLIQTHKFAQEKEKITVQSHKGG